MSKYNKKQLNVNAWREDPLYTVTTAESFMEWGVLDFIIFSVQCNTCVKNIKRTQKTVLQKNVWSFVKMLSALIWTENRIAKLICFEAALKKWNNWTDGWQQRNERAKRSQQTAAPSEGSQRVLYD